MLTVLALAVTFVVAFVVLSVTAPGATSIDRHVTVRPGETLSGIAARELPEVAVSEGVAQIQLANNLSSPYLAAGQDLAIPDLP